MQNKTKAHLVVFITTRLKILHFYSHNSLINVKNTARTQNWFTWLKPFPFLSVIDKFNEGELEIKKKLRKKN